MAQNPLTSTGATRLPRAWTWLALLGAAAWFSSCATCRNRPVQASVSSVGVRENGVQVERGDALTGNLSTPASHSETVSPLEQGPVPDLAQRIETLVAWQPVGPPEAPVDPLDGEVQIPDPDKAPVDMGLPFQLDLGAGEAPYDDGVRALHVNTPGRPGFSDSVIQLTWRERVSEDLGLHGTAAMLRFQDIAIIDGLADAEFGWFVLGVHTTF